MLKRKLEENINQLMDDNAALRTSARVDKDLLKKASDDAKKLRHHEKTQSEVLMLIDSLSVVLCPKSVEFYRVKHDLHRMAANGEQLPERPEDQMFDALQEVKTRLMNGGFDNIHLR